MAMVNKIWKYCFLVIIVLLYGCQRNSVNLDDNYSSSSYMSVPFFEKKIPIENRYVIYWNHSSGFEISNTKLFIGSKKCERLYIPKKTDDSKEIRKETNNVINILDILRE